MIYIGAWHKTGINIIKKVFRMYKEKVPEFDFKFKDKLEQGFNHHIIENAKAVLCIRNPYETIMSGMRYHQITKEKWYKRPQEEYNGLSYQEHICNIDSIEEKILFEMKNTAFLTINAMYNLIKDCTEYEIYSKVNTPYNINKNIIFLKIEQFWTQQERINIVNNITSHIPVIDRTIMTDCIEICGRKKYNKTHLGFNYTYQDYFTDSLYEEFNNLFPSDLFDVLGYLRK
jgi:hypothetical protein